MNEFRMAEEQEIDLWDFLKSMLEQWRGCLATALIFMVIVSQVKYTMDMKNYNAEVASATESANSGELAVAVDNKALVEKAVAGTNPGVALNYYVTWQQFRDSYEASILMKLDASEVRTLGLDYIFKCEAPGSDYVASYYKRLPAREDFIRALSGALGDEDTAAGFISELVAVTAYGSQLNDGGYLSVKIMLPEDADAADVENAVTSYLNTVSANNAAAMGNHRFSLVSSGVTSSYNNDVVRSQADAVSNIDAWKNKFYNVYKALTDSEKKEVDKVIASVETGEMSYQDIRAEYAAQKSVSVNWGESTLVQKSTAPAGNTLPATPSYSIKYVASGFVLGLFVYAGCSFLLLILIRRFRSGEEAASALGLRSYGDIYEYPYHGFAAFLHDKKVYAWRHKKSADAGQVAAAISAKADHGSLKDLTCVVLGDAGKTGFECIDKIVEETSRSGVKIDLRKAPDGLASLTEDEIGKFSPVLVTIVSGKTRPMQAAELLGRLKEYDIPVFGMNFIEK